MSRPAGRPPPRTAPGMAPARGVVAIIWLAVAARLTHVKARGASAGPRRMRWRRKGHYLDGQTAPLPLFRSTFCFAGVSLDLAPADRPLIHGSHLTLIGSTSAHEWPTNHRKRRSSRPHLHALLHRTLQNQTTNSPGGGTAKRPPTRKFLQRAAKPNQTVSAALCQPRDPHLRGEETKKYAGAAHQQQPLGESSATAENPRRLEKATSCRPQRTHSTATSVRLPSSCLFSTAKRRLTRVGFGFVTEWRSVRGCD
jgi:hypothetical protein